MNLNDKTPEQRLEIQQAAKLREMERQMQETMDRFTRCLNPDRIMAFHRPDRDFPVTYYHRGGTSL